MLLRFCVQCSHIYLDHAVDFRQSLEAVSWCVRVDAGKIIKVNKSH